MLLQMSYNISKLSNIDRNVLKQSQNNYMMSRDGSKQSDDARNVLQHFQTIE